MYLYWLPFIIVFLGNYVHTRNIYLSNQCSHFLGKIFICKRAIDNEAVANSLFDKDINRRAQNNDERPASILPNPWISLLTRKFRLKWTNQKDY
uniref:Secreted protein n=1 Tax=Wuchereria bancrofti TaxID=6293 RepID=A0AAF5PUU9_WUCBA